MAEVKVFENIMKRNESMADKNKRLMAGAVSFNMMSSPGAGKTTILEKTLSELGKKYRIAVIEGDVATSNDAKRLRKYRADVEQIKTENFGGGCHLDAKMVNRPLQKIMKKKNKPRLIIIENVGNLICPADFVLGEDKKVVVLSVTEGDDKPLKYPLMFEIADLMVLNKTDLLPYVDFSVKKLRENIKRVNKKLKIIEISSKNGDNMEKWYAVLESWIRKKRKKRGR